MKRILKKLPVLFVAFAMIFSVVAFAACKNDNSAPSHDYTVKVLGLDGQPYTSALVQICVVDESQPSGLGSCFQGVPTDSNGVAYIDCGKQIPADVQGVKFNEIEVHLQFGGSLGKLYAYEEGVRMKKGEEATIRVIENEDLDSPKRGNGTGSYSLDGYTGEASTVIDLSSFNPYVVGEGDYRLAFTSATQKIYFAFQSNYEAIFKVYSVGFIDASITQLLGTEMTTVYNPDDVDFGNDNVSATDKNFYYEFEVTPDEIENNKSAKYFEVSLEKAADVNKNAVICFEFVDDYEEGDEPLQTEDVRPAKPVADYAEQEGAFVFADLNGSFNYKLCADGFYHKDDENGPVLVACLGTDPTLNTKHKVIENAPRAYDIGFTLQHNEKMQSLTVSDGKTYSKDYYPLIEEYTKHSNSDGRYGVTEELKNFLDVYINQVGGTKLWVQKDIGKLPEGEEWLWACGYYLEPDGTKDNPFTMSDGTYNVNVPKGGVVYFTLFTFKAVSIDITSTSTNVSLKAYSTENPKEYGTFESDELGFACPVEAQGSQNNYYVFEFSTKDGEADSYELKIETLVKPAEPGSSENPIEIALGKTEKDIDTNQPVYFSYKITAADQTLFFSVGTGTTITVVYVKIVDGDEIPVYNTVDSTKNDLIAGLSLSPDTVILIAVSTESGESGKVEFTISNSLATE